MWWPVHSVKVLHQPLPSNQAQLSTIMPQVSSKDKEL